MGDRDVEHSFYGPLEIQLSIEKTFTLRKLNKVDVQFHVPLPQTVVVCKILINEINMCIGSAVER
jgi:hypothetical protein